MMNDMFLNNDNSDKNTYYGDNQKKDSSFPVSSYYSENHRKPRKRKGSSLIQLIIVALVGSILGGLIVFAAFQFVAPAVQPSVNSYFKNLTPNNSVSSLEEPKQNSALTGRKIIEIERTDSPVTAIAEKVSPSIVGIRVTATVSDFFFGEMEGRGEGSGIIARSDGYIITNWHVIQKALDRNGRQTKTSKIEVFLPDQEEKPYTAKVIGTDWRTDLAVIKIDVTNLPAAEFGNSDELKVGELAVAIGNPGGLEYMGSVTVGVISGLNRTVNSDSGKNFKLIQTDAAINPGNSGGALVNSKGQVIGVNSIKVVATGFEGIGFAIPINTVKEITDSLIEYEYVPGRPFLGISTNPNFDEKTAKFYNVPAGVLVDEVIPFSGAYNAGLKRGDIITKFNGKQVKTLAELNELKNKHKPNDKVVLEVYRNGKTMTIEVILTEDKN